VRELWKYSIEENIGGPESDTWIQEEKVNVCSMTYASKIYNLPLSIYKAMEVLHLSGVVTPRNPNSNAQHTTEKPLTTHGFQLPKSARLPTWMKTMAWARNVNPDVIKMTDVVDFVFWPPPQKTWHAERASQLALPNGLTSGLNPAWLIRFWKRRFEL
jgi:hypothetical protein